MARAGPPNMPLQPTPAGGRDLARRCVMARWLAFARGQEARATFPGGRACRFVVVDVNPDTPKFASNSRVQGTSDENRAAVLGSVGLFGTYTVAGNVVTMNVEGSTYPNWTGTVQTRNIVSLTSDELKWTLASSVGGTSELVFKRVK
jgi:hypothetical protein